MPRDVRAPPQLGKRIEGDFNGNYRIIMKALPSGANISGTRG